MTRNTRSSKSSREQHVDANFDGDHKKAEATERHEKEGTFTGVHIHFGVGVYEGHADENTEVKEAWRLKKYGFATVRALAVNFGKMIDAGTMAAGKPCGRCGDYVPGDINSLETLETLVTMAVNYAQNRPITKDECNEVLAEVRVTLGKQAKMNSRLSFDDLVERFTAVDNEVFAVSHSAVANTIDYRKYVETVEAVEEECLTRVRDNLVNGIRELADDLGGEKKTVVLTAVERILAEESNLRRQIGALMAERLQCRQAGAKYASQRADERASEGRREQRFTPRQGRGRGRGTHGGGRYQARSAQQ